MFEWGAAFIKFTGKLSWYGIIKFAAAHNAEPTTVLGCVIVSTSVIAGTYFFGPSWISMISTNYTDSLEFMVVTSNQLDQSLTSISK